MADWPKYEAAALKGAKLVRDEFALDKVASQFMRYLTFLAARPRPGRQNPAQPLIQKRLVANKGWLPPDKKFLIESFGETVTRLGIESRKQPSAQNVIDTTREIVLYFAGSKDPQKFIKSNQKLYALMIKNFKQGIEQYPMSLVLKFNYMRVLYHWGKEGDIETVLHLAEEIGSKPADAWQVDVLDDIFSWDVFNCHTNYREYFDAIVEHYLTGTEKIDDLVRMVRASAHYHKALITDKLESFQRCYELDSEFAYYGLSYAKNLLKSGQQAHTKRALEILAKLAQGSVVFREAYNLLESQLATGNSHVEGFEAMADTVAKMRAKTLFVGALGQRAQVQGERQNPKKIVKLHTKLNELAQNRPLFSVFVFGDRKMSDLDSLFKSLVEQSIFTQIEILLVHQGISNEDQKLQSFRESGLNIRLIQFDWRANLATALNACLDRSSGQFCTIAAREHWYRPRAFDLSAEFFMNNADAQIVYGDVAVSGLTKRRSKEPLKDEIVVHGRFHRRSLFSSQCIDPLFFWRKSIHENEGRFDVSSPSTSIYRFFRKLGLKYDVGYLEDVIGHYALSQFPESICFFRTETDDFDEARTQIWPAGWGALPAQRRPNTVPAEIEAVDTGCEFNWYKNWDLINIGEVQHAPWLMNAAKELLLQGDWLMAELVLNACIDAYPTLSTPYFMLSLMKKNDGDPNSSQKLLLESLRQNLLKPMLQNRVSCAKFRSGDTKGALALAEKACQHANPSAVALNNLGFLYITTHRYKKAVPVFKQLVKKIPEDLDAWTSLLSCARKIGKQSIVDQAEAKIRDLTFAGQSSTRSATAKVV